MRITLNVKETVHSMLNFCPQTLSKESKEKNLQFKLHLESLSIQKGTVLSRGVSKNHCLQRKWRSEVHNGMTIRKLDLSSGKSAALQQLSSPFVHGSFGRTPFVKLFWGQKHRQTPSEMKSYTCEMKGALIQNRWKVKEKKTIKNKKYIY